MTDTRLAGLTVEALTSTASDALTAGVTLEALTVSPSTTLLAALTVEVLTPSHPLAGRWGTPIGPGF